MIVAIANAFAFVVGLLIGVAFIPLLGIFLGALSKTVGGLFSGLMIGLCGSLSKYWVGVQRGDGYEFALVRKVDRDDESPGYEAYIDGDWHELDVDPSRWDKIGGSKFGLTWFKPDFFDESMAADGGDAYTVDAREVLADFKTAGTPKIVDRVVEVIKIKYGGVSELSSNARIVALMVSMMMGGVIGYLVFML